MFVIEQPIPPAPAADSTVYEGKPVAAYVLKMKEYVEQLERLGYVLPQDIIGEQHAMLIEYEKGLPKKTKIPQVMALRGGKIQKTNRKLLKAKVSKNDVLYFNAIPRDGIYEIDMHNLVPNVKSIYNVSNKRAKHNLESTYLWRCKMTRKSFPYHTERATDLLGKIHTDVCGPLRHVSRQGSSYFITFTDDYSHFGYVYLLKHKHEFFETFKVFKNEVENQLGKTIKALRSDRGGEYISQEFKDYLKACGIDYALESTTCILNMVPTKKFDKTSYELCGRTIDLKEIQDEDTSPSKITSKICIEVEGFEPPQEEVILIQMQSMIDNKVWVLVDLPPNCKTVGSKWIFKKKIDMDGILHTYKARLVANGYTQLYEVDYEETFSPVADIRAIRFLVSIAAFYDYEIWKMDVKTAFLNGYLDEDIYMVQPKGFFDPKHFRKVCKLQRSIYGLKKASRSWNKRFDEEIKKDRSKRLIILSQSAYMDKILKRYRMDNSTRGHILMQERLGLNKKQGSSTPEKVKSMQNVPYALVVGYIMYAVRCTRLDVAFAQNITSRLQHNPGVPHWTAVKSILKRGGMKSSKQSNTAMSATKAKYIAALKAIMEAVWIKKFIPGLGIVPTINEPIKMFYDNFSALLIANEPGVQKGARHYHRRYYYVRECIELGETNLLKVHIDDNLADPFMKYLPKGKLTQHARSIGLCLASSFMWICVLVFG
nr:hypothetical protein [Tanacetum cinerariifolium]